MGEEVSSVPPMVFAMGTDAAKKWFRQRIFLGIGAVIFGFFCYYIGLAFNSFDSSIAKPLQLIAKIEMGVGILLILLQIYIFCYKTGSRIEIQGDVISQAIRGRKMVISAPLDGMRALRTKHGILRRNPASYIVDFGKMRMITFTHDIDNRDLLISILENHSGMKFRRRGETRS